MSEDFQIQRTLGRMEEKLDSMGREFKELKADVRQIRQTCDRRDGTYKRVEQHLETDEPVEVFANKKVAAVALFVGAAAFGGILTKVLGGMM